MATEQGGSTAGGAARATFGVVLFIIWGILTILWVYDAVDKLVDGEASPAIRAVAAILLLGVLAGYEGFEVVYIKLWGEMYPERTQHDLAAWLAARQLFVAGIVVAATLLAERHSIAIPFDGEITGGVALKIFNLVWTTLTVLWFAQILPKVMAATNAERYRKLTQATLAPVVDFVRVIGISWPAEVTARAVQNRIGWHAEPTLERAPRRGDVLADAWAALTPEDGRAARRPPEQ